MSREKYRTVLPSILATGGRLPLTFRPQSSKRGQEEIGHKGVDNFNLRHVSKYT